ncbi:MAG: FecR family protein [Candidatus Azobacteroides sp.]|nr:FecR family protein [Candidatus Azobacteroides sp.]
MAGKIKQFELLMMKYVSGSLSDREASELLDILNSDNEYMVRYNDILKIHAVSHIPVIALKKDSNYKSVLNRMDNRPGFNRHHTFSKYLFRAAAIFILLLTTSISLYYIHADYNSGNNLSGYEMVVPHGSQSKIILPDGTVAWLNSGSTLKYTNSYGKRNRTVFLTGEGYFDVKEDRKNPFFVHAGKIEIKVLGTIFNVRAYSDEKTLEVDLLEGKIEIFHENDHPLILLPDKKLVYNKDNNTVFSYKTDVSRSTAWTTGKLRFVDVSLQDISKDLERRYDVKIVIGSQHIKDELFSGTLDLNQPIEKILEYIDVDKKYTRNYYGKEIHID